MCDIELSSCLESKEIDIQKILEDRKYEYKYSPVENIYNIKFKLENKSEYKELKEKQFCFDVERRISKVYLCNKPSDKIYNFIANKWKMKIAHFNNSESFHRGHYIARNFQKYLIPNDILAKKRKVEKKHKTEQNQKLNKINHFFGRGNVLNIYPQSAESNCGPYGQLIYESKVWNFLDKEKDKLERKVYYELENIIIDKIEPEEKNKKISLGRRIKASFFEGNKLIEAECFHVFIPDIFIVPELSEQVQQMLNNLSRDDVIQNFKC